MLEGVTAKQRSARKTSFRGDIFRLVSGTTLAQALNALAVLILVRFYRPEAFGVLALFTSIILILTEVSCLRYEFAIPLPEAEAEAANLMAGSILISFIVALAAVPLIGFGAPLMVRLFNTPELGDYLWLIPPTILVGGTSIGHPGLNYWATRTKRYSWLSLARVSGAVVTVVGQLAAAFFGFATGGSLILASVAGGGVVSTLVLGGLIWHADGPLFRASLGWGRMWQGFRRYRKFAFYDMPSILLNSVSWQLPVFMLSAFFSSTVAGYFSIGNRILRTPLNVIAGAVSQVFYQRASEARLAGTLRSLVEGIYRRLAALSLFPLMLMAIVGADLFVLVLGPEYREAGVYAQWLSVWTFFWFTASPLSELLKVLEKQELGLKLNFLIFGSRLLALTAGCLARDPRLTIALYGVFGALVYGFVSMVVMREAGVRLAAQLNILLRNFALFVPAACLLAAVAWLSGDAMLQLLVAGILLALYGASMIWQDTSLRKLIADRLGLAQLPPRSKFYATLTVAVCGATILLAVSVTQIPNPYLLVGGLVVLGIIVSLFLFLKDGKASLIVAALLFRASADALLEYKLGGSLNVAGLSGLAVIALAVLFTIGEGQLKVVLGYRTLPIWLLLFWGGLSAINHFNGSQSLVTPLSDMARLLSSASIFWMVAAFIRSEKDVRLVIRVIVLSALIPLAFGLLGIATGYRTTTIVGIQGLRRIQSVFAHPNNYAHYLLIILTVSFIYSTLFRASKTQVFYIRLIQAAAAISLAFTFSRSALIGLALAYVIVQAKSLKQVLGALVVLALLGLVFYQLFPGFVNYTLNETLVSDNPSVSTFASRQDIWRTGLDIIRGAPLFGFGPGSFAAALGTMAHNDYLRVLFEYGVPGLVLFLGLGAVQIADSLALVLARAAQPAVAVPTGLSGVDLKVLGRANLALTISFLVMGFAINAFNYPVLQWYLFAIWGLVVGQRLNAQARLAEPGADR
jgi:lipopolysaccharide exporter